MHPVQQQIYQSINKEILDDLSTHIISGEIDLSTIDNALVKLLRLVQVTSNPRLIDSNYSEDNPKLDCIDSLLEKINTRTGC